MWDINCYAYGLKGEFLKMDFGLPLDAPNDGSEEQDWVLGWCYENTEELYPQGYFVYEGVGVITNTNNGEVSKLQVPVTWYKENLYINALGKDVVVDSTKFKASNISIRLEARDYDMYHPKHHVYRSPHVKWFWDDIPINHKRHTQCHYNHRLYTIVTKEVYDALGTYGSNLENGHKKNHCVYLHELDSLYTDTNLTSAYIRFSC